MANIQLRELCQCSPRGRSHWKPANNLPSVIAHKPEQKTKAFGEDFLEGLLKWFQVGTVIMSGLTVAALGGVVVMITIETIKYVRGVLIRCCPVRCSWLLR